MKLRKALFLTAGIILVSLLVGCGGDGEGGNTQTTISPTVVLTPSITPRPTVESYFDLPGINGTNGNSVDEIGAIEQKATVLSFSPDGRFLVVGTWNKGIIVYDVVKMRQIQTLPNKSYVTGLAFSPDTRFLVGSVNTPVSPEKTITTVYVWKTSDWSMVADGDFEAIADPGRTLDTVDLYKGVLNYAPNGTIILTSGHISRLKPGKILLLRVEGSSLIITKTTDIPAYQSLWGTTIFPNGQQYFSGDTLYDISSGEPIKQMPFEQGRITTSAVSPDGNYLAFVSLGSTLVHIINIQDFTRQPSLIGASGKILSLDFSPDGSLVMATTNNHKLFLWRIQDNVLLTSLSGTYGAVFSPEGNLLAAINSNVLNDDQTNWSILLYGVTNPGRATPIPTKAATPTQPIPPTPAVPLTETPPSPTKTMVIPTSNPDAVAVPTQVTYNYWNACGDASPSRLQVGMKAYVAPGMGANRVRDNAGRDSNVIGSIPEMTEVVIIEGPQCSDGWVWWKVQSSSAPTGWTSEGEPGVYWLVPK